MAWHGRLALDYRRDSDTTVSHDRHEGPLRVLQRLYPEGPAVCHHVLVHPPGGMVGGDRLDIELHLQAGSHALLTTPGAARFYRSAGEPAVQSLRARLDAGARLEWLPLETLAYSGCLAENHLRFELAPGAETIGWDLLALGLPAAGAPFERGRYLQHLELPGRWLERGAIAADDTLLLDSPLGLAGRRVLGTLWFAAGTPLAAAQREALLDSARAAVAAHPLAAWAGATAPDDTLVLLRAVAERVEPLTALFRQVRGRWREQAWGLPDLPPRIWRT
ncbi:MAG: urease accessory protein UreD [Piscinibacter sp.]|uniref:urease accessory protein UreD n=1 Tax=Piscinibacter sp. TaxID=1903157 RepID=UPI002582816A|nr:urease accessory protein UreD [Piscinibacter sp.]MCW5666821.1 urease accessory protein UreD [Piscinibacter sp.]